MYNHVVNKTSHFSQLIKHINPIKPKLFKTLLNRKSLISKRTGKPIIHFAHANGIPSRVYAPIFDVLSEYYTVVFIPIMGQACPLNVEWDKMSSHSSYMSSKNNDTADKSTTNKQNAYPIDNHWRSLTRQVIDSVEMTCRRHQVDAVIGLGHSLGSLCTLQAIYRQPKLFHKAVLMDPPLIYGYTNLIWHIAKLTSEALVDKMSPAGISKNRRDVWNSRKQAYQSLSKKSFFKVFDPRCFDNYIKFGLTSIESPKQTAHQSKGNDDNRAVTLTIPKKDEVEVFRTNPSWYWLTPNRSPKVPVTLLIGEQSPFYQRGFVQKINKRLSIPYKRHEGGHMFPLEHPESVANTILQSLE